MFTFFKNLKHNFGPHKVLILENSEINYSNATSFLADIISEKLKAEQVNCIDFSQSAYHIVITTTNKEAYKIAKQFVSSYFGDISIKKVKKKYFKHYHIIIKIKNIENLMKFLNNKAIYPIYNLTNNFPEFDGSKIKVKVPTYVSIDQVKSMLRSNKVNIRYTDGDIKMKTYEGHEVSVSSPVLQDTWNDPIIYNVSIYDKTTLVMHLSPPTIEKLNSMRKLNSGRNICFEVDNVIYTIFTLRANRAIPSDLHLLKCKDSHEAREVLKHLNIGLLSSLKLIREEEVEASNLSLVYFLIFLILALVAVFLFINRKKFLTFAMVISLILFVYFSYSTSCLSFNMLTTLAIQQLIFILISVLDDKINHFGGYFTIIYIIVNVLMFGYGSLFFNAYFKFLTSQTILSSAILLLTYNITKAVKFKSENDNNDENTLL